MNYGTFSAKYIKTIIEVATQYGARKKDLLYALELSEEQDLTPVCRICSLKTIDLFHYIINITGNPHFGLHVGQSFKPGTFDILGYAIMCSRTLEEAIRLNFKYQRLNQELGKTPLYQEGNLSILEWQTSFNDKEKLRPVNETVIAGYVCLGRWLTWQHSQPIVKIEFTHSPTDDLTEYQKVFNCPVEFNAKRTAISFKSNHLKIPLQQADPTMVELMTLQLDRRLKEFTHYDSVKNEVSCFIQSLMGTKIPTLSETAVSLGYHERTLRRRLNEEKTTYSKLVDKIRKKTALAYLNNSALNLVDIALMLGYQDQSAFSRAFRNWFNMSPGKYRSRQRYLHLESA